MARAGFLITLLSSTPDALINLAALAPVLISSTSGSLTTTNNITFTKPPILHEVFGIFYHRTQRPRSFTNNFFASSDTRSARTAEVSAQGSSSRPGDCFARTVPWETNPPTQTSLLHLQNGQSFLVTCLPVFDLPTTFPSH